MRSPIQKMIPLQWFLTMFCGCLLSVSAPRAGAGQENSAPPTAAVEKVWSDAWYTMQAGSLPWGYYHEIIAQRGDRFSYKYAMTKVERGLVFQETIGALADLELTPVSFNLVKAGSGTTEITDGTYVKTKAGGIFNLEIKGATQTKTSLPVTGQEAILDVFAPVWFATHWNKLKLGYEGNLRTLAENGVDGNFQTIFYRFKVGSQDPKKHCLNVHLDSKLYRVDMCINEKATIVELSGNGFHVRKVASEAEAKRFLSGVLPPKKKNHEHE